VDREHGRHSPRHADQPRDASGAGTPAITGYDLQYWTTTTNRYASGWSLDGSRDGYTWETLDTVTNFFPIPPAVVGAEASSGGTAPEPPRPATGSRRPAAW
jgi:hypothetical protein